MYKALEVTIQEDLSQFSRLLWQKKISHRILEVENSRILVVSKQAQLQNTVNFYQQWKRGEVVPESEDSSDFVSYIKPEDFLGNFIRAFSNFPLTLSLIIICVLMAFIAPLNQMTDLVRSLLYPDFSYGTRLINLDLVQENFSVLQLFKMITPILLHGGILHLAFNMLWLWEFGRRIEFVQPSWALLILVLFIAIVSNTVQFLYGGTILFGGMSGVVYGLFAYIWMWQLFDPAKKLALPGALVFFLLLSLFILTYMDLGFVADEAHIGGLLSGVVYGAVTATISRIGRAKKMNTEA